MRVGYERAGGIHEQRDLKTRTRLGRSDENADFIVGEIGEAVHVDVARAEEPAIGEGGFNLHQPAMGIESILAQVCGVLVVEQRHVAQLVEQRGEVEIGGVGLAKFGD